MAEAKKGKASKEEPKTNSSLQGEGLYRSETNKILAGVAGGLGEYFNIDPTIIRILFVLLAVFGGSGFIIYIVLWLIIPSRSDARKNSQDAIRSNIEDMKNQTQTFAHSIGGSKSNKENSKFWWALIIIILGFLFLMKNFGLLGSLELEKLWPLALIIFGLAIIVRK